MDRRQRRTRRAIYDAFEELMAAEHYSSVTVAQIIERADVGRSTFYAHFETKDELLQSMCTEMFDHIFEGVNAYCVTHRDLATVDLGGKLAHLLYHLRDTHRGIPAKLVAEGEPHYTAYFRAELSKLFEAELPERRDGIPADLATGMLVSAFVQAVAWWVANPGRCTPEQLAGWVTGVFDGWGPLA